MVLDDQPAPVAWADFDPRRFVGRRSLLEGLLTSVGGRVAGAVQLVGPRWIGKSAVLRFLAWQAATGALPAAFVWIYVDLERARGAAGLTQATEQLYTLLQDRRDIDLQPVARAVSLGIPTEALSPAERDQRLVALAQAAADHGLRVVLCLDHLDRLAPAEMASLAPWLKTLPEPASLLLALRQPLVDIVPGVAGSPLAHKLLHRAVDLLQPVEAHALLAWTPPGARPFTTGERETLVDLVGLHPYLLRRAADAAFELVAAGQPLTPAAVWLSVAPSLRTVFAHLFAEHAADLAEFWRLAADPATNWDAAAESAAVKRLHADAIVRASARQPARLVLTCKLFEGFLAERLAAADVSVTAAPPPAQTPPTVASDAFLGGLALEPGSNEWRFLQLLVRTAGRVVPDGQILAELWPADQPSAARHKLHTTVDRVRGKLDAAGAQVRVARQWGVGYVLERD